MADVLTVKAILSGLMQNNDALICSKNEWAFIFASYIKEKQNTNICTYFLVES